MKNSIVHGLVPFLALSMLAGCLSRAPQVPVNWTIEWRPPEATGTADRLFPETLRVSDIFVRAPYDGVRLAVLRGDGSIAFDPYNVFAAAPKQLLRGAAFDAFVRSGRFAGVVDHSSQALADLDAEIAVTRLALDCREADRREALVELSLTLVAKGRVLSVSSGRAAVPVGDGNYSQGFSGAFSQALIDACRAAKRNTAK